MKRNIILATDSYKMTHHAMLPEGTEFVHSYFEHRGGIYEKTLWYGLQGVLLQNLVGTVVENWMLKEAEELHQNHFGGNTHFNREGWEYILKHWGGKLPLNIWALPEGSIRPVGTPLMAIENTDPNVPWLTNYVESTLLHVWYPATIVTIDYHMKQMFKRYTGEWDGLGFMLHDFGYRGVSSYDSAAVGGAAHLVNFRGTDTLPGIVYAIDYYGGYYDNLAFSVPATEHSIMTSEGDDIKTLHRLIPQYAGGILSVVADSYAYKKFIWGAVSKYTQDRLKEFNVKLVVRPDSVMPDLPTPEAVVVWTMNQYYDAGLMTLDKQSNKHMIDSQNGILWGDGLDREAIEKICEKVDEAGYSLKNIIFGMGGGLLQKINRDTLKSAIKSSAQCVNGVWHDVFKTTYGKQSKRGRQVTEDMRLVFSNGELQNTETLFAIRDRIDGK